MTTASRATVAFMDKLGETNSQTELMSVLNSEVDLNFRFEPFTPFMYAIKQGCSPDLIEEMISLGADPFICTDEANSLDIAAIFQMNPEAIRILAKQGFDSVALTQALFIAAMHSSNPQILMELVRAGANVCGEIDGKSLLMTAVANNRNLEVIHKVIELDRSNRESFEYSADIDVLYQNKIIESFLQNPDPEIWLALGKAGFMVNFIFSDEHTEVLLDLKKTMPDFFSRIVKASEILLETVPEYHTPLNYIALLNTNSDLLTELILAGADPGQESNNGMIPLFAAIFNTNSPEVRIEMIKCLLANGVDINHSNSKGMSPLHFAMITKTQPPELITFLLQAGANVNAATEEKRQSILHFAVENVVEEKIVQLLLTSGGELHQTDSEGCTPIHYAIAYGRPDLLKLFIDFGCTLNGKFYDSGSALHYAVGIFDTGLDYSRVERMLGSSIETLLARVVELIVATGIDVNEKNLEGQTPLEISLANSGCDLEVVRKLIELGAEVNSQLFDNYTPLMIAAAARSADFVGLLLEKGAAVNARADDGGQAIHMAAQKNADPGVITLLAEAGADLNSQFDGKTPLHLVLCQS